MTSRPWISCASIWWSPSWRKRYQRTPTVPVTPPARAFTLHARIVSGPKFAIGPRSRDGGLETGASAFAHDWNDPLSHFAVKLEGAVEARSLLFIPSKAPFDLYHQEMSFRGIQLYVRQVFIMDECKDIMPRHLRFIKGVVDSEDLSLNVSREILQQDRQIKAIRNFLVRKVFEELKRLKKDDSEKYLDFWKEFGPVLKEGLASWEEKKEPILELMFCASSNHETDLTTLTDYVSRMKPDQDKLFYISGPSRSVLEKSPHIENLLSQGYEVLFFTDRIDEVWLAQAPEVEGKTWQSVGSGEGQTGSDDDQKKADKALKKKQKELGGFLDFLKEQLSNDVKEVRLSSRLTSSAACLVGEENDMTPQMVSILKELGQDVPRVLRILELNPEHPIVAGMQSRFEKDSGDALLRDYARLLFGQAVLAEGSELSDPAEFSKKLADLMVSAV